MKDEVNSKTLKKALAYHLFWRLHFSVVIDEYQFMDLFGVRRNGYCVEYEIKVSKADFMRELNLIHGDQPESKYGKDWSKWYKHGMYLGKDIKKSEYELKMEKIYAESNMSWNVDGRKFFIPNEFNFYVPDTLTDFALSKLDGLPYGLIQYGKKRVDHADGSFHTYHSNYEVIKKPVKLHTEKDCARIMEKLAHGLTIRSRLLNNW
jgi:hypothetical protein